MRENMAGLTAEKYITSHWERKKIYEHLEWQSHKARFREIARLLRESLEEMEIEAETFCDVGCAYGHSTNILKDMHPGDWLGIDFSETAINRTADFFPNVEGLNFAYVEKPQDLKTTGIFDGVICSEVIEHVESPEDLRDGLLDITKHILIITTPNCFVNDPGHLRVYNRAMLNKLLRSVRHTIHGKGRFWYIVAEKK